MYDIRNYHCVHYALDKFKEFTGKELDLQIVDGVITRNVSNLVDRIAEPAETCFVVMQSTEAHLGVFHEGYVYHLDTFGEHTDQLHVIKFHYSCVRFYKVKS